MELFINYVVLTVKSAEEMLWCSYSNKTSWVELGKIHFFKDFTKRMTIQMKTYE